MSLRSADDPLLLSARLRQGRLLLQFNDLRHALEESELPWPVPPEAMPAVLHRWLSGRPAGRLHLQLDPPLVRLDWEDWLEQAGSGHLACVRHLLGAERPTHDAATAFHWPAILAGDAALPAELGHEGRTYIVLSSARAVGLAPSLEQRLREWAIQTPPRWLSTVLAPWRLEQGLRAGEVQQYLDLQLEARSLDRELRPVTALSVDLVGSTERLARLGAERYAQSLDTYYRCCRETVRSHGGSLDDPQGDDGLMAYFGFPLALEDAVDRALRAAWQLAQQLSQLDLPVRIGVATGQVAVSGGQAFGLEVHLAARLRAAAAPGEVLVAHTSHQRAGPGFRLDLWAQELALTGIEHPQTVYRLAGLDDAAAAQAPEGRFVGRQRELAQLMLAWQSVLAGAKTWRQVRGEAGIGKTRLLVEFATQLRAQGHTSLFLSAAPDSASRPFELLTAALGEARDAAPQGVHKGEHLLHRLMTRLSQAALCVIVDDAPWLDVSSIDLLKRAQQASSAHGLLIVTAERSADVASLNTTSLAAIELQGLSADDCLLMVRSLEAGRSLSMAGLARLIDRAAGVPLYLEESLRVAEGGSEMPARLEDLLMVRLEALGPDRVLAQRASVFGREFSATQLDALLQAEQGSASSPLRAGGLHGLLGSGLVDRVEESPPRYRFKHALIRDAAYRSIWQHDRLRLHSLCADVLAAEDAAPGTRASHLQSAGRLGEAQAQWLVAAQSAAASGAHPEALKLARQGLALGDDAGSAACRMQLHLLAASASVALQGYASADAEAAYRAAECEGQRSGEHSQALRIRLGLEACLVMRGDLAQAETIARELVAATDWSQDARLSLQSRWSLANVLFHRGAWQESLAHFDDCLAHYHPGLHRPSSVQDPAVMCLGYSSWTLYEQGRPDDARQRLTQALHLAGSLRHAFSLAVAHCFSASVLRLLGDSEQAWPHAQTALEISERGGFRVWLAHAWMVLGQLRADRGEIEAGDQAMDRGYAIWVESGARISCATYLVTRAEIQLRQGRTALAEQGLALAWQISESIGEHYYQSELLRLQALCHWQAGDPERAEAGLQAALALAEVQSKPGLALRCAMSLGSLLAADGRFDDARAQLASRLDRWPAPQSCRDFRLAAMALQHWAAQACVPAPAHTPWEPA